MDVLSFLASVVGSLAWPVATVVLALIFREPLRSLVDRMPTRVKAGPFEVEWPQAATRAAVALARNPDVTPSTASHESLAERLQSVAEAAPAAAVMQAFADVERALRHRIGDRPEDARLPLPLLVWRATERGVISRQTADALNGLRVLRNLAAHGREEELDTEKALDFLALSDAVLYAIQRGGNG